MTAKRMLVIGGASSGKSQYATEQFTSAESILFIATAFPMPDDQLLLQRIERARQARPSSWQCLEWLPAHHEALLERLASSSLEGVILDSVPLMIAQWMNSNLNKYNRVQLMTHLEGELSHLIDVFKRFSASAIIVTSEVGCGVVPNQLHGRDFRDIVGWANQQFARWALDVVNMTAGLPTVLKSSGASLAQANRPANRAS